MRGLDSQAEQLGSVIEDLRKQISEEEEESQEGRSRRAGISMRYNRLREAIADDRSKRANMAELSQVKAEYSRAKELRERDLISPAEFERTAAAFMRQRAVTLDTKRIRAWRSELEDLSTLAAADQTGQSPTEALLQATLMRSIDLDLNRVNQAKKVQDLGNALEYTTDALNVNVDLEYAARPWEVAPSAVRDDDDGVKDEDDTSDLPLHERLARVLGSYDFDTGSFEIVEEAAPPVYPAKSTLKLIAAVIALAVIFLGFFAIITWEVLSPTLRSASEIPLRLDVSPIGILPVAKKEELVLPGRPGSSLVEASRVLAERLRVMVPPDNAQIVITSSERGEGRSLVAAFLASAYGRRHENVFLVDAEVRRPRRKTGLEFLDADGDKIDQGLGELLLGEVDGIKDVVRRTVMPHVMLIPRGRAIDDPEPLGSRTMQDILEYCSKRAKLTIIVAPPSASQRGRGTHCKPGQGARHGGPKRKNACLDNQTSAAPAGYLQGVRAGRRPERGKKAVYRPGLEPGVFMRIRSEAQYREAKAKPVHGAPPQHGAKACLRQVEVHVRRYALHRPRGGAAAEALGIVRAKS